MAVMLYSFTMTSVCLIHGIISFSNQDSRELDHPHKDALVLALGIRGFIVRLVCFDIGSAVDIMQ